MIYANRYILWLYQNGRISALLAGGLDTRPLDNSHLLFRFALFCEASQNK